MHLCKILLLFATGLLCINARVIKRKNPRVLQRPIPTCGCPRPLIESACTYGSFGTCNCQNNVFLDEVPNRPVCGCQCQYLDTYGVLNAELPNYGRVPAIKLPNMMNRCDCRSLPITSCDAGILPAINLPELYEVVNLPGLGMPGFVTDLPCICQAPLQYVETSCPTSRACGCRLQSPIVECLTPLELTSPILPVPMCGCQNMPCGCQSMPCSCKTIPCGFQTMSSGCQNMPCRCQNVIQYGSQLPALELPCGCQSCQLSPVELPVCNYGCQSLPPPVIGCGGKYLRQVTIPPPFL